MIRPFLLLLGIVLAFSCANEVVREDGPKTRLTREELWAEKDKVMKKNHAILDSVKPLIQTGDLVVRQGMDLTSEIIQRYNKTEKLYSHCGIAEVADGKVYVYHTLAGDENPGEIMLRDPIDSFCNPAIKNRFGIFRYQLNPEQLSTYMQTVQGYYAAKMRFDRKFDLKSDERMYCGEIVAKALSKATNGTITIPTSRDKDFIYYAIDNMYLNPWCREVKRCNYEQVNYQQ